MDPHNNVPDLARTGRVVVTSWTVWPAIDLGIQAGGVTHLGGDFTLRLINMADGAAVLIPYELPHLRRLAEQLQAAVEAADEQQQTEGS